MASKGDVKAKILLAKDFEIFRPISLISLTHIYVHTCISTSMQASRSKFDSYMQCQVQSNIIDSICLLLQTHSLCAIMVRESFYDCKHSCIASKCTSCLYIWWPGTVL